jgi:uncharacterized protein
MRLIFTIGTRIKNKSCGSFLSDISNVASSFVPSGEVKFIEHEADNLVLELALVGGCDVLVTGDKKHLLPLGSFRGIQIEPPSKFLERFK